MHKGFYWLVNNKRKVIGLIKAKNADEALRMIRPQLKVKYACHCDFNFVPKANYILFSSPFLQYRRKI